MKRIILLILLLLLSLSTNVFAHEGNIYEVANSFRVACPLNWEIRTSSIYIKMTSPNQPTITIMAIPILVKDIDDEIMYFQNALSKDKNISSLQLEEGGVSSVDNLEARYRLYSINDKRYTLQQYHFMCFAHSEQFVYSIFALGNYNDLGNDRKIIDEIIASIKILK